MSFHAARKAVVSVVLLSSMYVPDAWAKWGCESVGKVSYRIGTAYEHAGIPAGGSLPGQVVATGQGLRSGEPHVLQCKKGVITFDHVWVPVSAGDTRPLTIGGLPSGLGLKVSVRRKDAEHFRYPSATHWNLDNGWVVIGGTPVDVTDESVHYDIVRVAGPLRFGRLDPGVVGQSFATNTKGGGRLAYETLEMAGVVVQRPACGIVVDDLHQVVRMGDYGVADFRNADGATPWLPFHLRVSSCPYPAGLIARFTFGIPGDATPDDPQGFALPGPRHVALQLATADLRAIAPARPVVLGALGNGQRFTFHARLRQAGSPIGGGRFSRQLRLMVEFL
ncbi:hypothetical protein P3W33_13440 [Luteibacter sp. PPL552]